MNFCMQVTTNRNATWISVELRHQCGIFGSDFRHLSHKGWTTLISEAFFILFMVLRQFFRIISKRKKRETLWD